MGIFIGLILFCGVIQFCFCQCKWIPLKFVPLILVLGLFLWMEASRVPGPDCGVRTEFEIVLIGACAAGVAAGWIAYWIKGPSR